MSAKTTSTCSILIMFYVATVWYGAVCFAEASHFQGRAIFDYVPSKVARSRCSGDNASGVCSRFVIDHTSRRSFIKALKNKLKKTSRPKQKMMPPPKVTTSTPKQKMMPPTKVTTSSPGTKKVDDDFPLVMNKTDPTFKMHIKEMIHFVALLRPESVTFGFMLTAHFPDGDGMGHRATRGPGGYHWRDASRTTLTVPDPRRFRRRQLFAKPEKPRAFLTRGLLQKIMEASTILSST